jgi:hypothetical protein
MIATWDLDLLPNIDKLRKTTFYVHILDILFSMETFYLNNNTFFYNYESKNFFIIHFSIYGCFIYGYQKDSEISPYQNDDIDLNAYRNICLDIFKNVPNVFHNDIKKILLETIDLNNFNLRFDVDNLNINDYKEINNCNFSDESNLEVFIDEIISLYPRATYFVWRENSDLKWNVNLLEFAEDDNFKDGSEKLSILEANILTVYLLIDKYQDISYEKEYDTDRDYMYLNLKILEHVYSHKPIGNRIIKKIRPNISIADLNYIKTRLKSVGYPVI